MKEGTLDVQRNHKVVGFQDVWKALQGLVTCRLLDRGVVEWAKCVY